MRDPLRLAGWALLTALALTAACSDDPNISQPSPIERPGGTVGGSFGGTFGSTGGGGRGSASLGGGALAFDPNEAQWRSQGSQLSVRLTESIQSCSTPNAQTGLRMELVLERDGGAIGPYSVDAGELSATWVDSDGVRIRAGSAVAYINQFTDGGEHLGGNFRGAFGLPDGGVSELNGLFDAVRCP